jgi:hypothetical protein
MGKIIELQESLRRVLPKVFGCKDYAREEELLTRVDRVLRSSGVEALFLELSVEELEANAAKMEEAGQRAQAGAKARERCLRHGRGALRSTILKNLASESYRELSASLAHSALYRWFCGLEDFEKVRVPGKSTLRDYAHWLPVEKMHRILDALTLALGEEERARVIGLESELDLSVAWVDTTALKANIHFPSDWVLLRDGVRTLIKSVVVIRRRGLRPPCPLNRGNFTRAAGRRAALPDRGRGRAPRRRSAPAVQAGFPHRSGMGGFFQRGLRLHGDDDRHAGGAARRGARGAPFNSHDKPRAAVLSFPSNAPGEIWRCDATERAIGNLPLSGGGTLDSAVLMRHPHGGPRNVRV